MGKKRIPQVTGEKCYMNRLVTAFTIRRGNLRIDYKPTSFTKGSISFSRETSDPLEYLQEIPEKRFLDLKSKVLKALEEIIGYCAIHELPEINVEEADEE